MKIHPTFWLVIAILACIGGLAAFFFLFILDLNIYWLILSPVILAIYLTPAAYFAWLYKKARCATKEKVGKKSAPDGI